jgi:predicted permease
MADLKLAVRRLARTPFVTTVAVLSLALGIGANAGVFSLFDQMLLRELPVREPDRLVNLGAPGPKGGSISCTMGGTCEEIFSYPMFRDLERAVGSAIGLAGHRGFDANLAYQGQTSNTSGMLVSGSYFGVLGLAPALGRLLGPEDDVTPGAHPVAVLGHHYWTDRLGGDPDVAGRTLTVNGQPMTIVGVAPRGFRGTTLGYPADVFVPISMRGVVDAGFDGFANRRTYWVYLFGRLAPGVTPERALAELNPMYQAILREVELPLQQGMTEETRQRFPNKEITLAEGRRGQTILHQETRQPLTLLLGITAVVLLIACANIANLLLVRGADRGHEMAIRGSLGAARRRLLAQLLSESFVLAALGGLAGLLVAHWTLRGIGAIAPAEASADLSLRLDPSVVLVAAALSIGTGILVGMYPALHATRADLATALRSGGSQPAGTRTAAFFRSSLVVGQIALSMALLVAAGLFIRSLVNLGRVDLGIEANNLVTFVVSPEKNGYAPEESRALFERMEEELAAIPGVAGVSAAVVRILSGSRSTNDVSVEGFDSGPGVDANSHFNAVEPGYFATLGIPLLAGRTFTPADAQGDERVVIVNEAFTRKFGLDPRSALGKRMAVGRRDELDMEIVGLVADARYQSPRNEMPPLYVVPYRQCGSCPGSMTFYVRTAVPPAQVVREVAAVVERLDPDLPVAALRTMSDQLRETLVIDRLVGILSAAFALLATLLAAIGLYGVLAYTVAQRTREIGLRMALGAKKDRIRRMVLRQVIRMMILGGAIGIAAAIALGRVAGSLLFGLEGNDPLTVVLVTVVLGLVGLAAGYIPALRASRVDPMVALRYE